MSGPRAAEETFCPRKFSRAKGEANKGKAREERLFFRAGYGLVWPSVQTLRLTVRLTSEPRSP